MRSETYLKSISFCAAVVLSCSVHAMAGTWQQFNKPGAYYTSPCGIDGSKIVGQYRSSDVTSFRYDGSTWTDLQMPSGQWSTDQGGHWVFTAIR